MAAAKWCDAVERMRKADQSRRGMGQAKNTNAYYRACGESLAASDALVALAEERLAVFCREMPAFGLVKTGERLGDGTAVFRFGNKVYIPADFHMKHFRKGVFRSFGASGRWPAKDLKIGKRERRLAKTRFRLHERPYLHKLLADATHDDFLIPHGLRLEIPASALFTAEYGKEAARLVLFYSEEFRGLPKEIKQLILRKLY